MNTAVVAISLTAAGLVLTAAVLLARTVRGWSSEVSALRQEIAALRLEMERARRADLAEVRGMIREEIDTHSRACVCHQAGCLPRTSKPS